MSFLHVSTYGTYVHVLVAQSVCTSTPCPSRSPVVATVEFAARPIFPSIVGEPNFIPSPPPLRLRVTLAHTIRTTPSTIVRTTRRYVQLDRVAAD